MDTLHMGHDLTANDIDYVWELLHTASTEEGTDHPNHLNFIGEGYVVRSEQFKSTHLEQKSRFFRRENIADSGSFYPWPFLIRFVFLFFGHHITLYRRVYRRCSAREGG